ncbi:flagellar hook-basal body complex protein FliE [Rossellomorea vietnamensis]|jgi:flagellar hook-basal body complex protein FliE|uniref:Flagellar hook-basal body complex protein FliE n=1 Tax=Rossellomorea vietnamensis TaxID=218284 RepID=A0A6I6UH46_9BACI|nr:flagellar hook-basal body complex protein FliE [Rossellomorea vietnamensis]QHE61288.1 flagellar hook-basal body complex protein FliE [Rossellomorea vietnamensis]
MAIHNIGSVTPAVISPSFDKKNSSPSAATENFSQLLKKSIDEVNKMQVQSDQLTEKLVRGETVDLHQVMIASQKASITLQTTMEVRNKVVEAYQEIMRMPM